jgi:hypothetical protein
MLRAIAAGGAALALLTLAACGRQPVASTSQDAATLGAFVADTTTSDPAPSAQPGRAGAAPAAPQGSACAKAGQKVDGAYRVLIFLVSSDTGTSVRRIADDLRAGQSLNDIAGGKREEVEQQALGLVQSWVQFAQANGKVSAEEAARYRAGALVAIDLLMAADVSACVPAVG